jgi:DNA-binding phage protein
MLTRIAHATFRLRAERDAAFRHALLRHAIDALFAGDVDTAKALLRVLVTATLGIARVATEMGVPVNSLRWQLRPSGNPRAECLLSLLRILQRRERIRFRICTARLA